MENAAISLPFLKHESQLLGRDELGHQQLSPYFFIAGPQTDLEPIFRAPQRLFFEAGKFAALKITLEQILTEKPDFTLCMTTAGAYRSHMAYHFSMALNSRFALLDFKHHNIITCLQETVVNGIVHGNLGISGHYKTVDSMDAYYIQIEQKLKLEPYKNRRVTVCAWDYEKHLTLSVTDQGSGFFIPEMQESNDLPHGRGLQLVQSLSDVTWLSEDLRTIYMRFNY